LGSTIENVLKHTYGPVMIVTTAADQREPKMVLMPIGGAHLDQKALENVALNTTKSFNGELTALYVIEGGKEKGKAQAEKVLSNTAWKAEHFDVKFKKIIDFGDPAETILKHADSHDLIIMGAGKRGIFKKVVMGHVAREMCATSTLPVILVRGRHIR
jgi:nucleotide-binding universal stress UspA family protein